MPNLFYTIPKITENFRAWFPKCSNSSKSLGIVLRDDNTILIAKFWGAFSSNKSIRTGLINFTKLEISTPGVAEGQDAFIILAIHCRIPTISFSKPFQRFIKLVSTNVFNTFPWEVGHYQNDPKYAQVFYLKAGLCFNFLSYPWT